MKKALLTMAVIIMFAASSFASVSFLIAPGVGAGKIGLLGMYATNHMGVIANDLYEADGNISALDVTALGIRACYGIMDGLDLLAAYSMDTLPNIKNLTDITGITAKQKSGNTTSLGVKYTLMKDGQNIPFVGQKTPVDIAVAAGYEYSEYQIKLDGAGTDRGAGQTAWRVGMVFSKMIDNMVPYGGIGLAALNMPGRGAQGDILGSSLAFNIGLLYGLADNMGVMIEYNVENIGWGKSSTSGDTHATSISGISLGFAYVL